MIKLFKFIAIAEGISYVVLFFNMLVVKRLNLELYKLLLYPIGMAHGLLFMSYVTVAFLIWKNQKWTIKEFLIVQLGSLIPFGTFYVEKKYLRNA
jgi:integral membrane protein